MTGSILLKILVNTGILIFPFPFMDKRPKQKTMKNMDTQLQTVIKPPDSVYKSGTSIEEALLKRRSVREYKKEPLELKEISQLLWAAQGITSEGDGGRTAPSAGALYPLELYVVSGNINLLTPGVYHYQPSGNTLQQIAEGDKRKLLTAAALMQGAVNKSAAVIVIAAEYKRTTGKYLELSLIHISEPTRRTPISYAVFCL